MDCRVVYAIVPKSDASFEDLLRRRALAVAERVVQRTERTMTLEAQGRTESEREESIQAVADDLYRTFSPNLWEEE